MLVHVLGSVEAGTASSSGRGGPGTICEGAPATGDGAPDAIGPGSSGMHQAAAPSSCSSGGGGLGFGGAAGPLSSARQFAESFVLKRSPTGEYFITNQLLRMCV